MTPKELASFGLYAKDQGIGSLDLHRINQKIQKDYISAYKADAKCFKLSNPPMFDFKNLGIEFKDGKITFYASFDFANETCFYLYGYTSVEFTNEEIQQYLKQKIMRVGILKDQTRMLWTN